MQSSKQLPQKGKYNLFVRHPDGGLSPIRHQGVFLQPFDTHADAWQFANKHPGYFRHGYPLIEKCFPLMEKKVEVEGKKGEELQERTNTKKTPEVAGQP